MNAYQIPPPAIIVLATRLMLSPVSTPGVANTGDDRVGSTFTIDPAFSDYVRYATEIHEDSFWVPQQVQSTKIMHPRMREHLRFSLPPILRPFNSDLTPFFDGPVTESLTFGDESRDQGYHRAHEYIYARPPAPRVDLQRLSEADSRNSTSPAKLPVSKNRVIVNRLRATFLAGSTEGVVRRRRTDSQLWLESYGADGLKEIISRHKTAVSDWLDTVRMMGLRTRAVASSEMDHLRDCLGDGNWVRGITVGIDTSQWPA